MTQSTKTVKGISKGKRNGLSIQKLLMDELCVDVVTELRFAAELTGGTGKGLRERLRQAGVKDWRFDLAIPDHKIAIELEGGLFVNGRHGRGLGMISDMNKYNFGTLSGWRILRFTHTHHKHAQIIDAVKILITKFDN